jgi:hypothetical protein
VLRLSQALHHRHTLETVQPSAPECSSHRGTLETDWLPPSEVSAHAPLHHGRGASPPLPAFSRSLKYLQKYAGFFFFLLYITKKHFLNIFHENCLQLLHSPHTLPRVKPMPEKTFSTLLCYPPAAGCSEKLSQSSPAISCSCWVMRGHWLASRW